MLGTRQRGCFRDGCHNSPGPGREETWLRAVEMLGGIIPNPLLVPHRSHSCLLCPWQGAAEGLAGERGTAAPWWLCGAQRARGWLWGAPERYHRPGLQLPWQPGSSHVGVQSLFHTRTFQHPLSQPCVPAPGRVRQPQAGGASL